MKIFGKLQQQNYEQNKQEEKKLSQNTTKKETSTQYRMKKAVGENKCKKVIKNL